MGAQRYLSLIYFIVGAIYDGNYSLSFHTPLDTALTYAWQYSTSQTPHGWT